MVPGNDESRQTTLLHTPRACWQFSRLARVRTAQQCVFLSAQHASLMKDTIIFYTLGTQVIDCDELIIVFL
jgi:hypothetical protein